MERPESSVQSPESRVQAGFSIQRSESSAHGPASRVQSLASRVQCPEYSVQRPESMVQLLRPESRNSGMPEQLPCIWVSSIKRIMLSACYYSTPIVITCDIFYFMSEIVLGIRFSIMYHVSHMFCNFAIIVFSRGLFFYHILIDADWNLSMEETNLYQSLAAAHLFQMLQIQVIFQEGAYQIFF